MNLKFPNPYDFAHPITNMTLFAGRSKERTEINYYLDHATEAPRPISIALLGDRAAGKTSLLNYIEYQARERKFVTVRINLDESSTATQFAFFYKILDSLLLSACKGGAFNGITGKVYDTYIDITTTFDVPQEKEFTPLLFPIRFAKAMQSKTDAVAEAPDNVIQADLELIRKEVNRPIIMIFDECNTLNQNRVILQKLRNIFMNLPGYMLVFAGTPDLFPVMDDVFSPIIRQFKKIQIREFADVDDTTECITKPLETISGASPDDFFSFDDGLIQEIHDLTGGRPYEIQLVCHSMFRRVQEHRAPRMTIDIAVLDDVRRELESTQNLSARPVVGAVSHLDREHLAALRIFCACDRAADFEQLWGIEYLVNGTRFWTREKLSAILDDLLRVAVLTTSEGKISFCGDEFDKIYTKYFARQRKIQLTISEMLPQVLVATRIDAQVQKKTGITSTRHIFADTTDFDQLVAVSEKLTRSASTEDVFLEGARGAALAYRLFVSYRESPTIPILAVHVKLPWGVFHLAYYYSDPKKSDAIAGAVAAFAEYQTRAMDLGGSVNCEVVQLNVPPVDRLVEKLVLTKNGRIKSDLAGWHVQEMATAHVSRERFETAQFHATIAKKFVEEIDPHEANNLGYYFLVHGDFDVARPLLERAVGPADALYALALYNLSILNAQCGKQNEANQLIQKCVIEAEKLAKRSRMCRCLVEPRMRDGALEFGEIFSDLDLLRIARRTKETFDHYSERNFHSS